jgi:hypothetical protein
MKHYTAVYSCVLLLALCAGADQPTTITPPGVNATAQWWDTARTHLEERAYHVVALDDTVQAWNQSQQYRAHFTERGLRIESGLTGDARWTVDWRTTSFGRSENLSALAAPQLMHEDNRATLAYDGIHEWYVNRDTGIEQGFTIEHAPAGNGPLVVVGTLSGATPVLASSGEVIHFEDPTGQTLLHYSKLITRDARGDVLPSRMEVAGQEVRLVVDDAHAVYPLEIDPVLTNPIWEFRSNIASSFYGHVGDIGDVNNDGYDDLGVGASQYPPSGKYFIYYNQFPVTGSVGFSATPDWEADGLGQLERFGESSVGADFDGDGLNDLALGAYMSDRVDIYYNTGSGLSTTPQHLFGPKGSEFGMALTGWSDYNVLGVGAPAMTMDAVPDTGGAYIYYGGGETMEPLDDENFLTIDAPGVGIEFGFDLSFGWYIGDKDGNGEADPDDGCGQILIGSPAAAYEDGPGENETFAGRATVFSIPLRLSFKSTEPAILWDYTYPAGNTFFGREVTAGSFNGVMYHSAAFGVPDLDDPETNQENQGGVVVFLNDGLNLAMEPSQTLWSATPQVGFGIDTDAGYFDDDGKTYEDLVVGVPFSNAQRGHADVYLGADVGLDLTADCYALGFSDNSLFGAKVSRIGVIDDSLAEGFGIGATFEGDLVSGAAYGYQLSLPPRGCFGDPDAPAGCHGHDLPFKEAAVQEANTFPLPAPSDLVGVAFIIAGCLLAGLWYRRKFPLH